MWVTGNQIAPGPARYQSDYGHGSGIIVGNAYGGSADVRGNAIDCVNPWALGIFIAASSTFFGDIQEHAVIEKNRVTVHGSLSGGIALMGSVTNTLVRNNKVMGEGEFALGGLVWITPADTVGSNTFEGNNTSLFESFVADVLFDVNTHQNVVRGSAKSVIDLGVDNWISGTSTGPPPLLQSRQLRSDRSWSLADEGSCRRARWASAYPRRCNRSRVVWAHSPAGGVMSVGLGVATHERVNARRTMPAYWARYVASSAPVPATRSGSRVILTFAIITLRRATTQKCCTRSEDVLRQAAQLGVTVTTALTGQKAPGGSYRSKSSGR